MHEFVFNLAVVWLVALAAVCVVMIARATSGLVRVLALDTLTLVIVALLIVYSVTTGTAYYIDAAVVLALISFVSVIAAVRYHAERRLF